MKKALNTESCSPVSLILHGGLNVTSNLSNVFSKQEIFKRKQIRTNQIYSKRNRQAKKQGKRQAEWARETDERNHTPTFPRHVKVK